MTRKAHYISDIPAKARPRRGKPGEDGSVTVEYFLNRRLVGRRCYDKEGYLYLETPLQAGKRHGREYWWHHESDQLSEVNPCIDGLPHGIARQWDHDGRLIGTYRMVHGTGWDLWRERREDGSIYLSEAYYLKDGRRLGFNWFINEDQRSVYIEGHWAAKGTHGIYREWNFDGRLARGFPQYYVRNKKVTKREYLRHCRNDPTLPPYRKEDDHPERTFPPAVAKHLRPPKPTKT